MTKDGDFKRLVRERAGRTGQSYMSARRSLRDTSTPRDEIFPEAVLAGGELVEADVEGLERHVSKHPGDVQARARLVGYYMLHSGTRRDACRSHAIWFIANQPRSRIAGSPYCRLDFLRDDDSSIQEATALWLAHIDDSPNDAQLLANARDWFLARDRRLAIALGERVIELTNDAGARLQLAAIRRLSGESSDSVLATLGERPHHRAELPRWLQSAAWASLWAGQLDYARELADELLGFADDDAWYGGNSTHFGHLIRGHVALAGGDTNAAERELVAAAATRGSPQLNSFGPNFSLARALLEKGRTSAVITFLDHCRTFWPSPSLRERLGTSIDDRVEAWKSTIEAGGIPDFGANAHYGE